MIQGKWYPPGSATMFKARLSSVDERNYLIGLEDGRELGGTFKSLKVANRLGNVERKITLDDNSVFTTKENDKVDMLFKEYFKVNKCMHALESNMSLALLALCIMIFSTFAFFTWGVPWGSKHLAHALPHKTNKLIAVNTLDFLDKYLFEETKLSAPQREAIRKHFKEKLIPLSIEDKDISYTLHFRDWNDGELSIPNALALPSGDIILTDKFVQLCASQEEMDSVILHEMGHVVHRHSLEILIETTFVSVAVMLMLGDANVMAEMGVGLGSLLLSSAYSRGHESQADLYAFNHMLEANIDPIVFSQIMKRMRVYTSKQKSSEFDKQAKDKQVKTSTHSILDYLSSHPSTQERVNIANKYSDCYKKGFKKCKVYLEK